MKLGHQNEVLNIKTSEGSIEQAEEFKYLEVTFTSQGETTKAIQERITLGQRALGRLKRVWNNRHISQELKIRLLTTIVIPNTFYGEETWIIRKREKQKLTAFENRCLRRICGTTWQDRISSEEIREARNTKQKNPPFQGSLLRSHVQLQYSKLIGWTLNERRVWTNKKRDSSQFCGKRHT